MKVRRYTETDNSSWEMKVLPESMTIEDDIELEN